MIIVVSIRNIQEQEDFLKSYNHLTIDCFKSYLVKIKKPLGDVFPYLIAVKENGYAFFPWYKVPAITVDEAILLRAMGIE